MGKKRKKGRSVKKNLNVLNEPEEIVKAPHSFVIHKGLPGGHTLELTKDFRKVMEPYTASHLKERKKNTIKDFVSIAGPLHVTHLSIFSLTELGMYLKIMRLPRGPTLTFKVHNFSLARDVVSSLKKQAVVETAFKHSPLIVLNSFSGEGLHMKLMASMFQNMFPTINLTSVDLNTIKRCIMMNYNPTTKCIDFRHYTIKVAPVGISKGVKKVVQGKVPNLGRCNDITDFFSKTAMLSESEAEDDPSNHVTLSQKLASRGNIEAGKSAIRLSELGPRLTLQLMKIEDGLLDGEVLYHDHIYKTEEEKLEIQKKRELKRKLKDKRKKIQEANKRTKEHAKEEHKQKSLEGMKKSTGPSEGQIEMKKAVKVANQEAPIEEDDDKEYYRQEVGEEPDSDLFSARRSGEKRQSKPFHTFKNNKRKLDDNGNISVSKTTNKKFKRDFESNKFKRDDSKKFKRGERKPFKGGETKKFKREPYGNKNKTDFKKGNKTDFKKGNRNDKTNKFGNKKGRRVDKTNSQSRDFRPIGGARFKTKSKFGGSKSKTRR